MSADDVAPVHWNLQRLMTDRGIRFAAHLRRRLVAVLGDDAPSEAQLSRMVKRRPERLTIRTLEGLCEVLACSPGDLLTRSTKGTSMQIFTSVDDLAEAIGLEYEHGTGGGISGFGCEADWGWRVAGFGSGPRTANGGGWLVTFASASMEEEEGHLIAYEVDANDRRTGRSVLIRSPWTRERDTAEMHRAMREGWWQSPQDGEGDLHELDHRLVR